MAFPYFIKEKRVNKYLYQLSQASPNRFNRISTLSHCLSLKLPLVTSRSKEKKASSDSGAISKDRENGIPPLDHGGL